VFQALRRYDYEAFAQAQLQERQASGLPPYAHLALVRAEARSVEVATAFLQAAAEAARLLPQAEHVAVYAPVPPPVARVADVERVQMLVESASRSVLQRWLAAWLPQIHALRGAHRGVLRWAVDVDPQAI
jgi:primosomal protein N' (replication factor Y)